MRKAILSVLLLVCLITPAAAEEMFAPVFLNDSQYSTMVVVHNKRLDLAVKAKTLVRAGGEELALATSILSPKQSESIDVSAGLLAAGRMDMSSGSLRLEYEFEETGPIDATVIIRDRHSQQRTAYRMLRRSQLRGKQQEALVHLTASDSRAKIWVANTTAQPERATVAVFTPQSAPAIHDLLLSGGESRMLDITSFVAAAGSDIASVRLENDSPGALVVAGLVGTPGGAIARVAFDDLGHGLHDRILRAQFVLLGAADSRGGAAERFKSTCLLRNTTTETQRLQPTVKYLDGGSTRSVKLPAFTLGPAELRAIDLSKLKSPGAIPRSVGIATLEVTVDGPAGHVIGLVTNRSRHAALDSTMTTHTSWGISGSSWSADETSRTLISMTNGADTADTFHLRLFWDGGDFAVPPIHLESGGIAVIDIDALAGSADVRGRILDATAGTFDIVGDRGSRSQLRLERMQVRRESVDARNAALRSDATADEGGGGETMMMPDGEIRVTRIRSNADGSNDFEVDGHVVGTFAVRTEAGWSTGYTWTDETNNAEYSSDNPNIATVSQPPYPTIYINSSSLSEGSGATVVAVFADPCGVNAVFSAPINIGIRLSSYVFTVSEFPGLCDWTPVCFGRCTRSGGLTSAARNGLCYPLNHRYIQCVDVTMNGVCVWAPATCTTMPGPGACT